MQPGQWVSLKMTKFPTDAVATVKLVDPKGNAAATVGAFFCFCLVCCASVCWRLITPLLHTLKTNTHTAASFTPQSSDAEIVSWQVPADLAPGFYIFSASPSSNLGIKAMSSIIKVAAPGAEAGSAGGLFGRTRQRRAG